MTLNPDPESCPNVNPDPGPRDLKSSFMCSLTEAQTGKNITVQCKVDLKILFFFLIGIIETVNCYQTQLEEGT